MEQNMIMEKHMDATLPSRERAQLLLDQLSLEEKVFQLGSTIYVGEDHRDRETQLPYGIGQVAIYGGLPTKEENIDFIINLQKEIMEQSPHGIPAVFHIEALSGGVMAEATTFPTAIGLGASWDCEAVKEMSKVVSEQVRKTGIHQTLSPVLDVARDYRWGRISETFGEDPTLISQLGCAYVEGFQGDDLSEGVACTAKHFLGYGNTEGALNMTRSVITENELREVYAKPFEAAIRQSDIKSVMNSYSSYNGEPIVSSQKIMRHLLRDQLGFNGLTITDYGSTTRLPQVFKTAADNTDAAIACLRAGIDTECPAPIAYMNLIGAVREGKVEESLVDESALRALTLKFELGLFESPYPNRNEGLETYGTDDRKMLAKDIAKKSVVLTKNEGLLPINPDVKKIAVIGPCGDSIRSFYSTYSYGGLTEILDIKKKFKDMDMAIAGVSDTMAAIRQPELDEQHLESILKMQYPDSSSVFEALREDGRYEVSYHKGCHIKKDEEYIEEAVTLAESCDLVIMAVGGRNGWGFACTTGEGIDTTDITLTGHQSELIKAVHQANESVVLLHFDGHPIVDSYAYDNIPVIMECWLPGEMGGLAIKDVLVGDSNPGGRLPITVPRDVGQTPMYHYHYNGSGYKALQLGGVNPDGYINTSATPQLPFGHGLSYTSFAYSNFDVTLKGTDFNPVAVLTCKVTNTGDVDGDEVIQIYGSDLVSSCIRPNQELLGFNRIHLKKGESKLVRATIDMTQFAYLYQGEWILEKGKFKIWIGKNADDIISEEEVVVDKDYWISREERRYFAEMVVE